MNIFQRIRRDLVVLAIAPFYGFEKREREKKLKARQSFKGKAEGSVNAK